MRPAILAVMVLAAAVSGQERRIVPRARVTAEQEIKVPVGRMAAVELTLDGDKFKYAFLPPRDSKGESLADAFREYSDNPAVIRLRVIGYARGTAYVVAYSLKGDVLSEPAVFRVTIGEGSAPIDPDIDPDPGPGPGPGPADPLVARLRAALKEGGFTSFAGRLADGFDAAAKAADGANTFDELAKTANILLKSHVGAANQIPPVVKQVIGPEINAVLPGDRMADGMTNTDRDRAAKLFARLARVCREAGAVSTRPEGTGIREAAPRPMLRGGVREESELPPARRNTEEF